MKLLEVCVDSLASARAAKQGGADRLEFCSALAVGGLTPYADLLRQIKAEMSLPVRCLMRPRAGDFLYTKEEIDLLCHQIKTLHAAGADGFVIGALTPEGTLDLPAMHALLDACDGAPVTLHRCIDVSRDLRETYRAAAALAQPGSAHWRGRQRCHHRRTACCAARGAGFPRQLQNAVGQRHDLPPRGRTHGPARPGRVAHPAD